MTELHQFSDLWLLFFTGFLSATLLPGGSEANLFWLINQNHYGLLALILVATLGNTLGGMTNYYIGRCIPAKQKHKKHVLTSLHWLRQYGYPILLLSWLPLIGDPLCLAAGWLRMKQIWCWFFITFGKGLRYAFIALVAREILV